MSVDPSQLPPSKGSASVIKIAVQALAAVAMVSIFATVGLLAWDKEVPEGVLALGSASVGALSTLLVADRNSRHE